MKNLLINAPFSHSEKVTQEYVKHGKYFIAQKYNYYINRAISLPPLGLLYLATPLIEEGHEVRVLDAFALQLSLGDVVREAIEFQPDLIGINLYALYLNPVHLLTQYLKKHLDVPIVIGGPQASVMPEKTLEEFSYIDYLIQGWGEYA